MKRKVNAVLSFLLILCLCVSMVAGVSLPASAATTWTDRSVQQQIFTNTALAYFYKGDAMQYGSYYIASGYRYAGGITRGTPNRSPEDATSEDKLYNVCSAYPHDIYFEAFGEHILTDEMAIPATSQIHSVNFETDSVNSDFLTSVQNSTENYCYHGAMAKAAGFDVDTVDADARNNTADPDNVYADVLYYFGPDLDPETGEPITYATRKEDCSGGNLYTISGGVATLAKTTGAVSYSSASIRTNVTATIDGETLSTYFYLVEEGEESYYITADSYTFARNNSIDGLTAAEVDRIFAEELQPGDVIAVMSVSDVTGGISSGGHTMTYIGDIDGDGVGEIIHSKGSKYNNANQQLVSGDTSTAGYKRYVTQTVYDMASVKDASKNTFYCESAANTTDYLTGYDLVESAAGWSENNFDGKNGYGLANSATLCPGNGGNIAIEDWFSQLGPYAGLTSADQKVNPTGEYGVDYFPYDTSLKTTGGFYPGGDRSLLQPGAVAYSQFCVLRPLNSSRFNTGAWQEGSNTTKGRYAMGDLSVTKTASLTEKQTLEAGAEITYTIEFWNPDTVLAVNNSGSYTVNLTETLPANTQLVKGSLQCSSGVAGSTGTGTVTWNGITVDQGEKVTVSYTVKVSDSALRGDHVVSPEGTVELVGDTSAILNTKEYVHTVSGAELTDSQLDTLLSLRAEYAITDTGRGMDIANQVYEKLGADPAFPDTNTLLQDLLEIDDWSQKENAKGNYYKVKLSDNSKLAALMVPGYVGGRRLMTYDEKGIKTTENRLVSFNERDLEPGDILVCANVRERSSYFTLDDADVYVYLGKTDANHTYYAHYDEAGKYEVVNAPLKDIQIGESRVRYQYSPVLTTAMLDDFFILLRPTLGADDVSSYVSPVVAADESSVEAAKIGDTGYATLTDALNAAAAGDTITVAKDICLEDEIGNNTNNAYPFVINKNLTLDLNGHTISDQGVAGDGTVLKAMLLVSGGTVTVQNGTLRSKGTVAALSTGGAVNLTLKDMNVINTVSRAIRRTSGSSGDLIISGGFYSGESKTLPTIDIDTGKSATATADLYLHNAVVVHSENAPLVLRMGENAAAVISEATLTTNAQTYDEKLYSGTVSTDALVVDAIPVHSEFLYGRRYYPADTKAVIGNEKYTSLSAAITAAKAGDTITLVTDIFTEEETGTKVGSSIPKYPLQTNFDLTLDLNGHTIDDTGDTVHVPTGADHLSAAFRITGGTVEIKNGTISSAGTAAAVSLGATARVTFTDMVITNTTAKAVYVSGNSDCRVTVSGGYFKTADTPVYASAGSTVVTVENGAVLHSGTVNAIYMADGNCAYLCRAVLATDAQNYQPRALFTGDVTTDKSYAFLETVTSVTVKDTVYALGYGELYDLDFKAVIGENSYLSLSEALAAAQPGDTVTLVDDIRTEDEPGHKVKSVVEKYPLQIGMDLVLDLNGYTIDDTTDTVHVPSDANHLGAPIRITGGTVEIKNGTIRSAGTAAGLSVGDTAQVTLTNLELLNTVSYGIYISGNTTSSVTLSDCYCFGAINAVKTGEGSAAVTVKDGTILQSDTAQVLDMGSGTQAYLQKALLLTNAGSYQPQALFAGSVTPDEGYAYRSSVPSVSRKGTECEFIYADYYDLDSVNALIGNVGYSSLSDALDAAQKGDTITLVSDIYTELETGNKGAGSQINKYPFYIKYDLTLDLNGHTIDDTADTVHIPSGDSHLGAPLRTNAGCVTIKNGSIRSCGTAAAVSVGGSAQLTLIDVNVTNTVGPAVFVSTGASATLTISGGLYQTTADRTICVGTGSSMITFKDGVVLYSQTSEAIYVGSGSTAYLQRAVLATDAPDDKVSTLFTGSVTADSHMGYAYRSKITYATFNGEVLEFAQGEYYDLTEVKALIGATGYPSLSDALDAAQKGDTITLVSDIYTELETGNKGAGSQINKYPFYIKFDLTLDLNGHTIDDTADTVHVPSGDSHLGAPLRTNAGCVTIKNGSIRSCGTAAAVSVGGSAQLTLTDVNVINTVSPAVFVSNGISATLTISGGLYQSTAAQTIYVGTGSSVITFKDGVVLYSQTSEAIYVGSGNIANLQRAVLATDAPNDKVSTLFTGPVTADSDKGYAYRSKITYATVNGEILEFAQGEYYDLAEVKALIGATGYTSLSDALTAAQKGDTITLVSDIFTENEPGCNLTAQDNEDYPLLIQNDLTLDLNGHTIDDTGDTLKAPIRVVSGTVELKDGTIISAGTVAAISIRSMAEVTFTDVALIGSEVHYCEESTVTVDATCTADGSVTDICATCGNQQVEIIPATGHSYEAVVTAPTCTGKGYTNYTCACGDSYTDDEVAALGHSYETVTVGATCTVDGSVTDTCATCGDQQVEIIPATGHSHEAVVTAPSCTGKGYTTYTCACGDSYTDDEVAALGHNYETVTVGATCTVDGSVTVTCATCGDQQIEIIPATGHSYEAVVTFPGCTGKGYTTYTCACGDSYTDDEVAALGHNYETVTVGATCTADGSITDTCATCGDQQIEIIPATGHSHEAVVTAPTCTEAGFTTYTCHCGDTYTADQVEALGHRYETVTVNATCTTDGSITKTCTRCGDVQRETVLATGHRYERVTVDATCIADGSMTDTCSVCGDVQVKALPATGHSHQATVTNSTCTEAGFTTYVCHCGDRYVADETAALGHSYDAAVIAPGCVLPGYTAHSCSRCGYSYYDSIVPAEGHHYEATVTEPTYTTSGYTTYTCARCGDSYKDQITNPVGHNYEVKLIASTCTTAGYTLYTCNCGYSYTTDEVAALGHSFVDGICSICGEVDPDYVKPVVQPNLTLKAPTLEFKDMITVNAMFTAENIEDVVEMGMITYTEQVAEWSIETADYVIPGTTYDGTTGRYIATSQGIHAKYLGDAVYLACYAKLTDGSYVYTKLASYSPVQYAASKLKGTDIKLKQLVVAMLNYGAAAQTHFRHNVENLANATLTAEQIALPESYRSDMVSTVASPSADKQGAFANNKGFAKRYPSISFEGAFCINYFFTPNYAPVDGITLYYWNEADYEAVDVLSIGNASGSLKLEGGGTDQYRGDILGISAKELSKAVYVAAVYSDGSTTWTSGVLGYSIGAYCASQSTKGGTIADLAMATAVYGYHAKQYFT